MIKTKTITIRDADLSWLAQVVITSDGMFSCVSEYWNFSFAWRSVWQDDFRVFLSELNISYFGWKMFQGMAYVVHTKKVEAACMRFSEMVLPSLKEAMKQDVINDPAWSSCNFIH